MEIDITGKRFSRLLAIRRIRTKKGRAYWLFKCDCGREKIIQKTQVTTGKTKSCSCIRRETTGNSFRTHGMRKTRLYRTWCNMRNRCFNKNVSSYKHYGGRGITVCKRWMKFENFRDDMLPTYKKGLTIDRINNDGNYELENCKWSTIKEQVRNCRRNVFIEYKGKRQTIVEWSEELGLNYQTLRKRISDYKMPLEKAMQSKNLTTNL